MDIEFGHELILNREGHMSNKIKCDHKMEMSTDLRSVNVRRVGKIPENSSWH